MIPRPHFFQSFTSFAQGGCTTRPAVSLPPPVTPCRAPLRCESSSLWCSTSLEWRRPTSLGGLLAYPCFCSASFRGVIAHLSLSAESLFSHCCGVVESRFPLNSELRASRFSHTSEVIESRFSPSSEPGVGSPMKLAKQKHGYARSPPRDVGLRHSKDVEHQTKDSSQRFGARLGVAGGGKETAGRVVQPP